MCSPGDGVAVAPSASSKNALKWSEREVNLLPVAKARNVLGPGSNRFEVVRGAACPAAEWAQITRIDSRDGLATLAITSRLLGQTNAR